MENPRVPPTDRLPFRFALRTRWSDEDNMGVLNNAVYLTLLEEGRYRWCERLGLRDGFQTFGFVLAATNLKFLAPGRGGADVILELGTTALGVKSFTQAYRLGAADGASWLEAEAVMVIWDQARRRAAPMPEPFRRAILREEPHLSRQG
jgi:acyl-CoA thioester hydrolase